MAITDSHLGIKTHFPTARIKKLMQTDDDIGKVAQATPLVVSKALEIFMASLVEEACEKTRAHGSRRVTPQHLKEAVDGAEQFDFLVEIMEKYRDNKNEDQ